MKKHIAFPEPLHAGDLLAVTAPSSGVEEELHFRLAQTRQNLENLGFRVNEGQTIWTQEKCVSSPKEIRAKELQNYLLNRDVRAIIPPWGGEFLMDILPLLDWNQLREAPPTWFLGYSDCSTFSFTYTLLTGIASAHGPNYMELCMSPWDDVTAKWLEVLKTTPGASVIQHASDFYQSSWDGVFAHLERGFNRDTQTEWKSLQPDGGNQTQVQFSGRLLGGCLDTLTPLIGTSFAPLVDFIHDYCQESGLVWFLESCEMSSTDLYRHLWQMKMNGWFQNTNGVLLGRPAGFSEPGGFTLGDVLHAVFDDLQIPVLYDLDIGHVPPQITLVNGALADVQYQSGSGSVTMTFS